jgi:hypothetical protein
MSSYRDAIKQHETSLALCPMDETALQLNKCYLRTDQPLLSIQMFRQLSEKHPGVSNPLSEVRNAAYDGY